MLVGPEYKSARDLDMILGIGATSQSTGYYLRSCHASDNGQADSIVPRAFSKSEE